MGKLGPAGGDREIPLRSHQQGGSAGPPWVEVGAKGGDKEAGSKNVPEKPRECGATTGDARPPEWRKTHRVPAR